MRTIKRSVSIIIILVLLLNTMAFAEGAVDIEATSWAEPYISNVVSNDIMPTFEGDLFNPSHKVTKMEVLDVIYKIAVLKGEVTPSQVDGYLGKYQSSIDGLLIPKTLAPYGSDNHRAIAYAIENGVLRSSELSFVYLNGGFSVINKVDASVLMGKALNVYLNENVNKFYEIRFIDGGEITLMAWPYINLLIEKEIISKEGTNGYFYPNSVINRDVFSVYATGVLSELVGYAPGEVTGGLDSSNTVTSSGKISIIHYDKNLVEIRDIANNLEVYDATNAKLTLNGEDITIQNLDPNLDVKIEANGKNLVSLEVVQIYDSVEGTFSNVGTEIKLPSETYRAVEIKVGELYKNYMSLNSMVVERDYQTSDVFKLVAGDLVTFYYQGKYVRKIEAFSQRVVLEGVLQRSSNFNKGDAISVKLSNGKLLEQTLLNDISKVNITEETVRGDIVKVTMSKGVVVAIEATGFSSEATGRVTQIVIGTASSVTIINSDGTSKTYNIAKDAVLKNLGIVDNSGLYALRLEQEVTFGLGGVLVDTISINKAVDKTKFEAKITEIHENINLIKAVDADGKIWIVSLEASDQNVSDFVVDDEVFIYGVELSQDLFEADLIVILE